MRKLIATALFLICSIFVAMNLAAAPDKTADLKKADQDWNQAAQSKNVEQFMGFIGDDAYLCDLSGKWMHGKDEIKADWAKALADPTFKLSWTAESVEVSKDGQMGYTRGSFQGGMGGKPFSGSYATIWKKDKDGKWRVAVDIASAAAQQ
jgi:ketosteroid isomerase-like protein